MRSSMISSAMRVLAQPCAGLIDDEIEQAAVRIDTGAARPSTDIGFAWFCMVKITQYIINAAPLKDGRAIAVAGAHYDDNDVFYEANGQYSMVNTCNTWLGDGLRRAGVPMSRWTPLDTLVVWHLPKVLE